jgi:hypothetical protein
MKEIDAMTCPSQSEVTEVRLATDEVVHRVAAELRQNGTPRGAVALENGEPRRDFAGRANQAYGLLGGADPGPMRFGAVARAAIRLAYDTPVTGCLVRFLTTPMDSVGEWKIEAVTRVEVAQRIRRLVVETMKVPENVTRVNLNGRLGYVTRTDTSQRLTTFMLTVAYGGGW